MTKGDLEEIRDSLLDMLVLFSKNHYYDTCKRILDVLNLIDLHIDLVGGNR